MEEEKTAAQYWEQAKEWLSDQQSWLTWPFKKIAELWNYCWQIVNDGSPEERVILVGIILALVAGGYVAFMLGLRQFLIRMPGFNRMPFGMPQNDDYLVKPTGYDRPMEFEWRYPRLWVGGTEFDFSKAMLDSSDVLLFYLKTGTEVRFIPKPHMERK